MLSMATSMILLPTANAHTPAWQIPTYAYVWASPNPDGVGQTISVYMFLTNYYYGAQQGNNLRFHNFKLTITAPNGAVTTQNFATIIDTTSNQHTSFVPDQVGTYILNFTYPGETYTDSGLYTPFFGPPGPNPYTNDTFLPSSASTTVTVQQASIANALTGAPLPTAYWTRPIYGENTNWYSIASNWLGIGAPNYGAWTNTGGDAALGGGTDFLNVGQLDAAIGSQTSHVMWETPLQSGGVVGGNDVGITADTFFDGSAYLIRYNNPIILDGMLYYTKPIGFTATGYNFGAAGVGYGPTVCVNLRTGEQIWSSTNVPALSFGYMQSIDTVNEHGVNPPIIVATSGSTWIGFDGDTGNWLFNLTNVPNFSTGKVMGPYGNYLNYIFTNSGSAANPKWTLVEWNSSLPFLPLGSAAPTFTGTIDGGSGSNFDWNISTPYCNGMTSQTDILGPNPGPYIVSANYGDGILCLNGTVPSNGENALYGWTSSAPYTYFFVNLNASRGAIGSVLWWKTLNPPANNYTVVLGPVDWNTRVFLQNYKENVQWLAYSLNDGSYLWTAPPQQALDYYGSTSAGVLPGAVAYGNLYSVGYGGVVYCYNDLTGQIKWTYGNGGSGNSTNAGLNYPYGFYPTEINAIGNGIIYTITSTHTWTTPIYKGGLQRAINATDGSEIWTISGVTMEFGQMSYAMADGFNTWFNGYDNSIYVVGRGPSATTVEAPAADITIGSGLVIRGKVTDISAGTKQTAQTAGFPNGVPCISDVSMKEWMGYVYQQQPMPANATGVTVTLSVLDSNNNFRPIGTTTTDPSGAYSYQWKPDIPGKYIVYASFAGTNGYWPSSSETSFAVDTAPTTPSPTATAQSNVVTTTDLMLYIIGAVVAIIVAIAIGFALVLKKRP